MASSDDELLDLLGPLDPSLDERPPARGSDRYHSILEFVMQTDLDTPTTDPVPGPGPIAVADRPATSRPRRRRWRLAVGTAAAAVAVAGGLLVVQSSDAPPAEAAVVDAVDALRGVTSLEGELTTSDPGVSEGTSRIRVDGDDFEITGETRYADGHSEASTYTVVDGIGYETVAGQTTSYPVGPDGGLAPFGQSSAAVIAAALEGSEVSERGEETLDGVATTRYDIELTARSIDALSALTPNELAWFELEYPGRVRSLRVWVADDLVHQIEIVHPERTTRTRFFNFGGDITITAPPGPYQPATDG